MNRKTIINILMMSGMTGIFLYCLSLVWSTIQIEINIMVSLTVICVLIGGIIAKIKGSDSIFKLCMITIYVGVILIIIYDILILSGFLSRFDDYNEMKAFINSTGGKSEVIYVLAQFLQVTFIPIPSNIVVMLGDELFGPVKAFFLSMIGLLLGSMFTFFLGKTFGLRLATWLAGKEALEKYQKIVKGRDKALLTMMFMFPFFPDDLLCLIAGLTTMGYSSFFIIMIISRTFAIGGTLLVKNGLLNFIPFSGWGLPIWGLMIILMVSIMIYVAKYGDRIEMFLLKVMGKIKGRDYVHEMYPVEMGELPVDKNISDETIIILYDEEQMKIKAKKYEADTLVTDKEYLKP